ncbi:glycosyltransferase family 4 protein [Vibrio owensii]|uniref:glycosyltransferase family 4 protein n=1 Tax=Vibrio owensii TaxID=696485 RepID=UPI0005EED018|nr:glycosyltransferase family 4 protein [Vibrio owensii]
MKVVHFCSYYIGSKVYGNLFEALSKLGVQQDVFIPVRRKELIDRNIKDIEGCSFYYRNVLSLFTRLSLSLKIITVLITSLLTLRGSREPNIIHSHTLFSDGIAAFFYSKIVGGKLILTIRNTDVNSGLKFFRQYDWLVRLMLGHATSVIFISHAHRHLFCKRFNDLPVSVTDKFSVIPNGIDDFFVKNRLITRNFAPRNVGLYVGEFTKNKNLDSSINAFMKCMDELGIPSRFRIVGGSYEHYKRVYGDLDAHISERVIFEGRITSKQDLIQIYDESSIFIMPSFRETFGLVYIEALSRGLPLVFTKGQGIDGYFDDGEFGFSCDPYNLESIEQAIRNVVTNFPDGIPCSASSTIVSSFDWNEIASRILDEIYK